MATVRLQLRRGLADDWFDANPTLAAGEIGIETDTNTFKFGDGNTPWNSLEYALSGTVDDYIPLSTKAQAGGVASLDNSGFVPVSQLPPLAKVTVSAVANSAARLALTAEAGDIAIQADNGQSYVLASSPASTDGNWRALVGSEAVVDTVESALIAGIGLDKTYDDASGTITIDIDSTVATKTYADQAVSAEAAFRVSGDSGSVSTAAADATAKANAAQAAAASALSAHNAVTTNVHGIEDTSILVTTTGTQTLLSKSLTSPQMTGVPVAPTATAGTDTTQVATTAFVQDAIELVVGAAPAALNTLAEIATSLANNADLSGTLTSSISGKVAKSGDTMSGVLDMGSNKITSLSTPTANSDASTKAYVDSEITRVGSGILQEHNAVTTSVHGITNTANLVYTNDARLTDSRNPIDNSVATASLQNDSVTLAKIADSAVTTAKINNSAVTSDKIADGSVTTAKIADGAVTAAKIAAGAVETVNLADLSVTTSKIENNGVTTSKVLDGSITVDKLSADSVTTLKISDLSVTNSKLAENAVTEGKISGASVTTSKIADDAVTTAKIADSNITTAKINNDAVTSDKIASLAVTADKIGSLAVTEGKIADSAVTTGKIANGTIVDADVNSAAAIAQSKIDGLGAALDAKLASATAASTYAPIDSPTFTGTVAGVTKAHVGLANVDNTSDASKPVSTAQATAIATAKSEAIADATAQVNAVIASAPAALNTLDELAAALGDDANFATTVTTSLSSKAPIASPTFTGTVTVAAAGVAFTDKTQTRAGVPSLTTIASAISSNTTLDALGTDAAVRDSLIPLSGAVGITFEATGNAKYSIGSSISFYQSSGTGANFIESGITILSTPGRILRTTNSSVTATKVAATTWLLAGDLR
jgi:hypothetical protein